jgi:hypothetical protein
MILPQNVRIKNLITIKVRVCEVRSMSEKDNNSLPTYKYNSGVRGPHSTQVLPDNFH